MNYETALEAVATTFLNVEDTDLEGVGNWARRDDLPEPSRRKRDAFKAELARALQLPYTISPQLFEKWTHQDLETQGNVQERLQELWGACFGEAKDPN